MFKRQISTTITFHNWSTIIRTRSTTSLWTQVLRRITMVVPVAMRPKINRICTKPLWTSWRLNSVEQEAVAAFKSSKTKLMKQRKRCFSRTMRRMRFYPRPSCSTSLPRPWPLRINLSSQMTVNSISLRATVSVPQPSPRQCSQTGMALISRKFNIRRMNNSYILHWCSINNSTLSINFMQS